jgi:sugar/nucleoside kinase (ribokinase family)
MNKKHLNFYPLSLHYTGIIGTGGIGTGKFFQLNGIHTLGREESRSGHFLDVNDYCKQHIILHYVKVLLGPAFHIIPVGKVGDDDFGNNLLNEMQETGFNMRHIEKIPRVSTLFSFCFYYPDGSGGNLTTDNSASSLVDIAAIEDVREEISKLGTGGIIMAAPEVPLNSRLKLLELGREHGLFCTASFTSGEIREILTKEVLLTIDLLAVNIDEALAVTNNSDKETSTILTIQHALQILLKYNENMLVSFTAGKEGSWCWDGTRLNPFPAIKTEVVSTAGAGDAFFSGLLCGKALGLTFYESQQLATLIAGLSVQSPHTIHKGIDRASLKKFMQTSELSYSEKIKKLLED